MLRSRKPRDFSVVPAAANKAVALNVIESWQTPAAIRERHQSKHREFASLQAGKSSAALLNGLPPIPCFGCTNAQGLSLTEGSMGPETNATRAWSDRLMEAHALLPNQCRPGRSYSSTMAVILRL